VTDSAAHLERRTAELQQQADAAMQHLQARIAGVRQAQQQAMRATGEATSRDGVVRAVVDATGVVTSLTFAPTAFERSTPDRLAQTAVATIQAAAAQARSRTAEAMAAMRADDGDVVDSAAKGAAALGVAPLPVPEVPHTAEDPTAEQDAWNAEPPAPEYQAWGELGADADKPVDQIPPPVEPARGPAASNRPRRASSDDGADDWTPDERPW
jgi:DNA-binding protein YbaB